MTTETQETGLAAYLNGDFATALAEWTKLAEEGNAQAFHNLAILYQNGEGVEQSDEKAIEWCEKAAEAGVINAQTHLGFLLLQDGQPEKAATWFTQSAEEGDVDAQFQLGMMYHMGEGVAQDNEEAADWFEAAALQNHSDAQFNLGVLYAQGQRFHHARHWWQKAAELSNENAQDALAQLDEAGV
ncbi:tetratricopeptide repeat protein [Kingella negevensis]|uniref:tetratricopeptide repeat protein n=1 Tax=Kingella negevensis TaxID=1522312 RepID=UPI00050A25BE|nr:tetratricopeptide repeat protein [Kingella negevensis]MDK4687702.1 tetratricopeptide repeat protein [Kingella negevensis]WII91302.1 tetratricopeptide repeat protein [Kingella negevensis]WII92852.1 tetratricopeptide repeat protein [Kingella negevensis]